MASFANVTVIGLPLFVSQVGAVVRATPVVQSMYVMSYVRLLCVAWLAVAVLPDWSSRASPGGLSLNLP